MTTKQLRTRRNQLLKEMATIEKERDIDYKNVVNSFETQWYNNFTGALKSYTKDMEKHSMVKHELMTIEKKLVNRFAMKRSEMTQW